MMFLVLLNGFVPYQDHFSISAIEISVSIILGIDTTPFKGM
jgi:hypothetical protein